MRPQLSALAFCLVSVSLAEAGPAPKQADLLIVAGQSNAVGFDAKPGEMPTDEADQQIMFWWKCGDLPPDEHDSTSGGKWTHLQAQPLGNPKKPRRERQYGNFAQPEGGFGPEIGLARTLYAQEKKPLAVVKAAFSGTGLRRDWEHTDKGEGGACYRALIAEVRAAVAAAKKNGITLHPRDEMVKPVFQSVFKKATIDVTTWPTRNLTLAQIEQSAKKKVRAMKPDLVLIAVPQTAAADSDETFARSYGWVMNWSLNFGPPTWDVVIVHPSITTNSAKPNARDQLIRRLVSAQDLLLIDRSPGSVLAPREILQAWLRRQTAVTSHDQK